MVLLMKYPSAGQEITPPEPPGIGGILQDGIPTRLAKSITSIEFIL